MVTETRNHSAGPGRRILVTGGAGFIGSHLVERLLARGDTVTVIDDLSTGSLENLAAVARHPRLSVRQSRVSECADLGQLVKETDSIFHLAAAVGVDLVVRSPIHVLETNLHETEVLLELAASTSVPVLLTSTSEVYGKSTKAEFDEEDDLLIGPPHQARWSYACSKLMDEFLALAYASEKKLPVVIARLFNTVGPRQTGRYGMVLPRFIAAAKVEPAVEGLRRRPAIPMLLFCGGHGGSAVATGAARAGARPGVQHRRHRGGNHPGIGQPGLSR